MLTSSKERQTIVLEGGLDMRVVAVLLIAALISGCLQTGPTSEQAAELRSIDEADQALIAAHKMTHVDAANRFNAAIERLSEGKLTERDHLLMSYRLALASQVDAGQITVETAKYELQQKLADLKAQDRAAAAAAAAALPQSTSCTSTAIGNVINTNCF
jgi:hypothetical protein